jgi:threonine synthase
MKFVSTRGETEPVTFETAVFTGLAPDGGLYHPTSTPDLASLFASFTPDTSFQELAAQVTAHLFPEELSSEQAHAICEKAFWFEPHLNQIDENIHLLELFHGPSCAFKDFGASYLATVMETFLQKENRRAVILTATSGDTGSAVAQAFHNKNMIDVVILYPSGRVSPLQEKQLTTVGGNVQALEVKGSFDDCQKMVKETFVSPRVREKLPLTSANSINLGRLLPQSFYYIYAYSRLRDMYPSITFTVPSGNFGNLTSGVLAWSWGMKVDRFIAATNINDVVPEYLRSSEYHPRSSVRTYSNAMDVGDPSNFERLKAIFNGSWKHMQELIKEEVVTDEDTLQTIRDVYRQKNQFLDPHTAVGYQASLRFLSAHQSGGEHLISLATAHPGKFGEIVEEATGKQAELPSQLEASLSKKKQATEIENSSQALNTFLLENYRY